MAWRRIGDKPLPEPMLTRFTDAYMRHSGRRVNISSGDCAQLRGITNILPAGVSYPAVLCHKDRNCDFLQ